MVVTQSQASKLVSPTGRLRPGNEYVKSLFKFTQTAWCTLVILVTDSFVVLDLLDFLFADLVCVTKVKVLSDPGTGIYINYIEIANLIAGLIHSCRSHKGISIKLTG